MFLYHNIVMVPPVQDYAQKPAQTDARGNARDAKAVAKIVAKRHVVMVVDMAVREVVMQCAKMIVLQDVK
jgi:hypothetical protein